MSLAPTMTESLHHLPAPALENVLFFCNQSDLVSLAQTCHVLHKLSIEKLYRSIYVRRHPRLQSNDWFLDTHSTEVAGLRTIKKRSDQDDYLIYLKLLCLQNSLVKYGELVKELVIHENVFSEDGQTHLNEFVDTVEKRCSHLEKFVSYDESVRRLRLPTLKNFSTSDLKEMDDVKSDVVMLTVKMHRYTENHEVPDLQKFSSLKKLILDDEESASLRLLKILSEAGLSKLKLKRLVFNHVHGLHDYNTVLRALTVEYIDACVDLSQLEELEMGIGCQEAGCGCLGEFLDDLAPKLHNLTKVSFDEKTFHRDHYLTEEWDVSIGRFLINVKSTIKFLAIRHNPPMDGKLLNGLEGNYMRRRRLFERVVPELKSLEVFVSPTFLQSCACYEILPSDLLWNGCECSFCAQFLPFYDKYLMDHAYYDSDETDFRDMIAPRLFGVFGAELKKRLDNRSDLDALTIPPSSTFWNFHGYRNITCFNDISECMFDQKLFAPLAVCVSHFMLDSVKFLVKSCPRLRTVALTGVFFSVDEKREVESIYDTPERVLD